MTSDRVRLRWRLRELMARTEIKSYGQLSEALSVQGYHVSRISAMNLVKKDPRRLSVDALEALCNAFKCRIEDLFEQTWENPDTATLLQFPMPPPVGLVR